MNGVENKCISFYPGSQHMISVDDNVCELLFVNIATTSQETHFVLRPMAKTNYLPLSTGNESSICLQLLISHYDHCVGKSIKDIFFHANYNGGWKIVSFSDFEETAVKKLWPERPSSDALTGMKIVDADSSQWNVDLLNREDVLPLAITMWYHADKSVSECYSDYEIENPEPKATLKMFGNIEVYEYSEVDVRFHFSTSEYQLKAQLDALKNEPSFYKSSEVIKGLGDIGYLSYSLHENGEKDLSHAVYEPGEHDFPSVRSIPLSFYEENLRKNGIDLGYPSENVFCFEIAKELELGRRVFLPGNHTVRLKD